MRVIRIELQVPDDHPAAEARLAVVRGDEFVVPVRLTHVEAGGVRVFAGTLMPAYDHTAVREDPADWEDDEDEDPYRCEGCTVPASWLPESHDRTCTVYGIPAEESDPECQAQRAALIDQDANRPPCPECGEATVRNVPGPDDTCTWRCPACGTHLPSDGLCQGEQDEDGPARDWEGGWQDVGERIASAGDN